MLRDFKNTLRSQAESLAQELATVGKDFQVVGGRIKTLQSQSVSDFLSTWSVAQTSMPWSVVETLREMRLGEWQRLKHWALSDLRILYRVCMFGPDGDLTLRRDADAWMWHFIGKQGRLPKTVDGEPLADDSTYFVQRNKRALLWGEFKDDEWQEDRVAAANLNYEGAPNGQRLEVLYDEYSAHGAVQFIWFHDIVSRTEKE